MNTRYREVSMCRLLATFLIAASAPVSTLANDEQKLDELAKLNQQIPVLMANGQIDESIGMAKKALSLADDLEKKARKIAPGMPDAVLVNCAVPNLSLSSLYAQKGNYLDAIKYGKRTLEIGEQMGPIGGFVKSQATTQLASSCFGAGDIESAQKYINAALNLIKNDNGPPIPGVDKSVSVIPVLSIAAEIAIVKGNYAEARQYLKEAQESCDKAFGKLNGFDGDLKSALGPLYRLNLHLSQGSLAVAEQRFYEAKKIFEKCLTETAELQIQHLGAKQKVLLGLATTYSELADHKNATNTSLKAKILWEQTTPSNSAHYAFLLCNHAMILARAGEIEKARKAFNKLKDTQIDTTELGSLEPQFFNKMQIVAQKIGEHDKAISFGKSAIEAQERRDSGHFFNAVVRVNLARSYLDLEKFDEASDLLMKALAICSSLGIKDHRVFFETMISIDRLFDAQKGDVRTWKDKTEKFSRMAKFIDIDSKHLVLMEADENTIRMPVEKLKKIRQMDKDFLLLAVCKSPVVFPDYAKKLIEAGANVNARDENGWTPFMNASFMSCEPSICNLLRDNGADESVEDKNGLKAKDLRGLNLNNGEYLSAKELTKGQLFLFVHEYDKAIGSLSKAIELSPNKMLLTLPKAYHYRGIAYEKKGEAEKAKADKRKAKDLGY